MHSLLNLVILSLLLLLFAPSAVHAQHAPADAENAERAIRAVLDEMRTAAADTDAEALYAYVLDSSTPPIIEDGRLAPSHSAALANTKRDFRGLTHLTYAYDTTSVTQITPETVLWVSSGTATAKVEDGRVISAPFAETIVFVEQDGAWRVLHAHRSAPASQ